MGRYDSKFPNTYSLAMEENKNKKKMTTGRPIRQSPFIRNAKLTLKERGFYVDNLWQISDVQQNYDVDDDTAQEILDRAMTSDVITARIFEEIDYVVAEMKQKEELSNE